MENAVNSEPVSWKQVLLQTFTRLPAGIWTSFLAVIITFGLMLALLLLILLGSALSIYHISGILWLAFPVLIVVCGTYYLFAVNATVLRGVSGGKAIRYARGLIKGRWVKTLITIAPLIIVHVLIFSIFATVFFDALNDSNYQQEAFKLLSEAPPGVQSVLPEMPLTAVIAGTVLQVVGGLWHIVTLIFMTLLFLRLDEQHQNANTNSSVNASSN